MLPDIHMQPKTFDLNGGGVGILLLHGFTGAPPEMRLIGEYLHQRGITVSAPLLPGHGTYVEDMNRYRWTDWVDHAKQALIRLQDTCEMVFVAGLSMGSLIALNLAAEEGHLAGIILYSPSIRLASKLIYLTPVLKLLVAKVKKPPEKYATRTANRLNWSYNERPMAGTHELLKIIRHTRKLLPTVHCPLLIVQGANDDVIDPASGRIVHDYVASTDKEILLLDNSGHCLTIDAQWEIAAQKTFQFVDRHRNHS